jgi:hypothetical protein
MSLYSIIHSGLLFVWSVHGCLSVQKRAVLRQELALRKKTEHLLAVDCEMWVVRYDLVQYSTMLMIKVYSFREF